MRSHDDKDGVRCENVVDLTMVFIFSNTIFFPSLSNNSALNEYNKMDNTKDESLDDARRARSVSADAL